ncbi:MAG: patatin-like phospholipase family protein [Micavibrio aeruginosavorus]|nr:patatin-like phospholipase family protein [Micavibrio aeruginosavorus]
MPTPRSKDRFEFESTALLLQGGGALGAYQAGVYEALAEADILPDWIGGISIGAVNGAIIAGNKPAKRLEKLRGFWDQVSSNPLWDLYGCHSPVMQICGPAIRPYMHQISAGVSVTQGAPGFFKPHSMPPWFYPPGDPQAKSYYSTSEFRATLEKFIDFDFLNQDSVRFTTSAVNIRTGNYTIFDSTKQEIRPEHVMASGALPPALPAVEIDGDPYWDGGLISNTPLYWMIDTETQANMPVKDTLIFQVDLWSAEGEAPQDMIEVMSRQKEIQYSSRTRAITNLFKRQHRFQHAFAKLYEKFPDDLKQTDEAKILHADSRFSVHNIVHLIYRARHYQSYAKDYEFSRMSVTEHWREGYKDTVNSLRHEEIFHRPTCAEGHNIYDVSGTKGRVARESSGN